MATKEALAEVGALVAIIAAWVVIGVVFGDGPPSASYLLVFAVAWLVLRGTYYLWRARRRHN